MPIRTSTQDGNWSDTATWGGAAAPGDGDQAVIATGHDVVVDANVTVGLSNPPTPDGEVSTQSPTASTSAGATPTSLPTGTYRVRYTNVDSGGGESHYSQSRSTGALTNGSSQPRITFPALPTGVTSRNLYLTNTGGSAGTEKLYATGITGTTYDLVSASWMDGSDTYTNATALPNKAAIQVSGTGTLLIDNGVTLTVRGDVYLNGTTLTMDPNSVLEFDASASVGTTNTRYGLRIGTGTGTNASARLITQGTSGNRCTIRSNSGGGNAVIGPLLDISAGWQISGGFVTLAYTDFLRMGTATIHAVGMAQQTGTHTLGIDHCTFESCGRLLSLFTMTATSIFSMTDSTVDNSLHSSESVNLNHGTPSGGGSFAITRCWFDKIAALPNICDKVDSVFKASVNYGGAPAAKGTMTGCMWAKIGSAAGSLKTINEDIEDCYFYQDPTDGGSGNPQGITPSAGIASIDGLCVIDGCIFESDNDAYDGDMITSRSGVTTRVTYCIGVPSGKSPRAASGTLITQFGNATPPLIEVEHCTWFVGNNSALQIGESTAALAGDVVSFKSNILWSDAALSVGYAKCKITEINGAATDALDAADGDYNCGWNLEAGAAGGGYDLTFTGSPGANDIDEDPQFVDDTRDLASWAVHKGSAEGTEAGQIADAFTYLKADPTLVRLDLIPWVRAGFAPQNANLEDAGHDGVTIGAVEMYAGAATAYTFTGPSTGELNAASTDFTVTPNGDADGITVTPASDGAGTFTPTSVTFTGSGAETFTYTPTSLTGSPHTLSVTDDGGLTDPASIDYTVTEPAATSYTFTGPSSGTVNVASTNFTVTPNGDADGIEVTPASDGTGTFTPTSVTFTGSGAETFTYTPTDTAGSPHTLSVTDDGALTDPASIDYTVNDAPTPGEDPTGGLAFHFLHPVV